MSTESTANLVESMASDLCLTGDISSAQQIAADVEGVTLQQVQAVSIFGEIFLKTFSGTVLWLACL